MWSIRYSKAHRTNDQTCQHRETALRPAADIEHVIAGRHPERVDHVSVLRPGLVRHQECDDPAEEALRITRLR
jgi:hypothetical protein